MGFWDYFSGTLRDYHRDPFPHSLLRTRELSRGFQLCRTVDVLRGVSGFRGL